MSDSTDSVPTGSGGTSDPTKHDEGELSVAQAVLNQNSQTPAVSPGSESEGRDLSEVNAHNAGLIAPLNVDPEERYFEKDLDPARRLTPQSAVYLDHVERVKAEVARAAVEGREPELENPPAYSGSVSRRAAEIHNPNNQNLSVNMLSTEPAGVSETTTTGQEPSTSYGNEGEGEGDTLTEQDKGVENEGSEADAEAANESGSDSENNEPFQGYGNLSS